MKKIFLPLLLILALTACHERRAANVPSPTPQTLFTEELPIEETSDVIKKPIVRSTPSIDTSSVSTTSTSPMAEEKVEAKVEPKVQTHTKANVQTFAGGNVTDGLDIGMIRLGKEGTTTRLVFDSFKWNIDTETSSVRAYKSGYYTFTYNPKNKRITAVISGYRGFSALAIGKERHFGTNTIVKKIYREKYLDDSGFKFIIELNKNAKVNVFNLNGPGRIIVDLSPI